VNESTADIEKTKMLEFDKFKRERRGFSSSPREWRLLFYLDVEPIWSNLLGILLDAHRRRELKEFPPTCLLISYNKPFPTVGYYSDMDREINWLNCQALNVYPVRRWHLGGGTVFLGEHTAFMETAQPLREMANTDEAYYLYVGQILTETLKDLGVANAYYRYPNDLRVPPGKKIVGSAFETMGNFMLGNYSFNRYLPDMELSSITLNIPPEKFKDKKIKELTKYIASAETDGSHVPAMKEVKEAMTRNFKKYANIDLIQRELREEEKAVWQKYSPEILNEGFIWRRSTHKFIARNRGKAITGFHQEKYFKMIQVAIAIDEDRKIHDMMLTGDYFIVPTDTDEKVTAELIGLDATDRKSVTDVITKTFNQPGYEFTGATPEQIANVIAGAANSALALQETMLYRKRQGADPY